MRRGIPKWPLLKGRMNRLTTHRVGIKNWGIEMQDKIIGIVIFLIVGILMSGISAMGTEAGADWANIAKGALADNGLWAQAIIALTVAGMAMNVYTNKGLSGVDAREVITMLILAAFVGGFFPVDSWAAWLATAWILTGGGLLNKN